MKLIIQIPCYNEEKTLPTTLKELPRFIDGIDTIEVLIIDDGSTDGTIEVAREAGVDYIIRHKGNKGLAAAFHTGITACLQRSADIIVNTDGDNQYPGGYIHDLVQPIIIGQADMVIGDRQTHKIKHFSKTKRWLQSLGSAVVRYVSGTDVPDAPSGFRAMSRETALRFTVFTNYTYTLETIIQAGNLNLRVVSVPITTNSKLRESRLIRSIPIYVLRSATTILRLFMLYKPFRTFSYLSLPFFGIGMILWIRYAWLLISGMTARGSNVQSIILGGVLIILGFLIVLFGLIGDIIAVNRYLQQEILYSMKKQSLQQGVIPPIAMQEQRDGSHQQLDENP